MTKTKTMEMQGAKASQHETEMKEEKDDNNTHHKRVVESSSSPSTNFNNNGRHKSGDENRKDGGNESLAASNSERHHNNMDSKFIEQVRVFTAKETSQVLKHTSSIISKGEELESTNAEMGEIMEENQRLKQYLSQIMKDYQRLQKKFDDISEQKPKQLKEDKQIMSIITPPQEEEDDDDDEAKLVSLSLGRSSSVDSKKGNIIKPRLLTTNNIIVSSLNKDALNTDDDKSNNIDDEEAKERSLDLGLECKMSDDNSLESEGGGGKEPWPPTSNKVKNNNNGGDDEVVQQPPTKKARVSVRVRCDTPTMNDGCQWRKYGQKIAKGNPCPRAYYRCTVAPSCPVRKQVQRCAEDMSILITTYEGTHNHPLPGSATAMASTTSAAAYMLMSKSSSTSLNLGSHSHPSTSMPIIGTDLHDGLNFNILNSHSNPKPIYSPNSSAFPPNNNNAHPTITLDLTSTTSPSINQPINRVTSNFGARYPSTNLSFSTSGNSTNSLLLSWPSGVPNFGTQSYYNNNTNINPLDNIAPSRQQIPYKVNNNNNPYDFQAVQKNISYNSSNYEPLPDTTIAQAAKALTSDPSFQSILTATLSSFISGNNTNINSANAGSALHTTTTSTNATSIRKQGD